MYLQHMQLKLEKDWEKLRAFFSESELEDFSNALKHGWSSSSDRWRVLTTLLQHDVHVLDESGYALKVACIGASLGTILLRQVMTKDGAGVEKEHYNLLMPKDSLENALTAEVAEWFATSEAGSCSVLNRLRLLTLFEFLQLYRTCLCLLLRIFLLRTSSVCLPVLYSK